MTRSCIYRFINTGRKCCLKNYNENYCKLHQYNKNLIYNIIENAITNSELITENDIYKIYSYIYNNNSIYVKELIFTTFLKTIFINKRILVNIYAHYFNNYNIEDIISTIININKRTYEIENKINITTLNKIQSFIKYLIIKNNIYKSHHDELITNKNDPFTFDEIKEINNKERFIYNDGNNFYCFKAVELLYFIEEKNNNWNPYTKKPFNYKTIRNLKIFVNYFKLINNNNYSWTTISQAFTDVVQIIEKLGFYTNMEWFLKLTPKQIKNIIRLFKVISSSIDNNYFKGDFNNDLLLYYDFATEIIKLFENGNTKFLLCCNFMKALSIYSNDFYNSLPDWLADINNPVIISNNYSPRRGSSVNAIIYLLNIIDE